jgi:hypothetical protein
MKIEYPFSIYDLKIILSSKGCFGECPIYNITILGSGKVCYEGIKYIQSKGEVMSSITRDEVLQLFKYALDIDFFTMPDKFETNNEVSINIRDQIFVKEKRVLDAQVLEISIGIENNFKAVSCSVVTAPSRLLAFAKFIDDICKIEENNNNLIPINSNARI